VELGVHDGLPPALRKAQARLRAFGESVEKIGRSLAKIGAAGVAGMMLVTRTYSKVGDKLAKMARRTGFSVEALSALQYAAQRSGLDLETLETGLRRMQRSIYDAGRGLSTVTQALTDLGLSYQDLRGHRPEEQFRTLANALSRVHDATRKAGIAQQIFGRSGTMLLPMFERGARGLDKFAAEARKLGLIMDTKAAEAAERLTDEIGILKERLKYLAVEVGKTILPVVERYIRKIGEAVQGTRQWIKAHGPLVQSAAAAAPKFAAAGMGLMGLGAVMKRVIPLVKTLGLWLGRIGRLLLRNPFMMAAVAVAGLATAFWRLRKETEAWHLAKWQASARPAWYEEARRLAERRKQLADKQAKEVETEIGRAEAKILEIYRRQGEELRRLTETEADRYRRRIRQVQEEKKQLDELLKRLQQMPVITRRGQEIIRKLMKQRQAMQQQATALLDALKSKLAEAKAEHWLEGHLRSLENAAQRMAENYGVDIETGRWLARWQQFAAKKGKAAPDFATFVKQASEGILELAGRVRPMEVEARGAFWGAVKQRLGGQIGQTQAIHRRMMAIVKKIDQNVAIERQIATDAGKIAANMANLVSMATPLVFTEN